MSCVTKQSLSKDLKNLILDMDWKTLGVKSNLDTSNAKPSVYGDRTSLFIPIDNINSNKNTLYGKLKNLESLVNKNYQATKNGPILSFNQIKNGYELNIHPTTKLVKKLNAQYEGTKAEYFNSPENTYQENQEESPYKYNEPIGDNYIELLNWKKQELENTEKELKMQRISLQVQNNTTVKLPGDTPKKSFVKGIVKELEKKEQKLKNQITMLEENKVDFMFHAIYEDLADMKSALENSSLHNIEEIRERVKFYENFSNGLNEYKEEYDKIAGTIKEFLTSYDKLRVEKLKEKLDTDISIQNTLKELNKDNSLKQKFGKQKIEGEKNTDGTDKYEDFTVDDLLVAVSDLSILDKNQLGIISSTTGDTILPQFLMKEFRETLFKKQFIVRQLVDELDAFNTRTKIKERDFLLSRDKKGNLDGFLVDVFNKKWFDQFTFLNNKIKIFTEAKGIHKKASYLHVKDWFDRNAHIIDFTRLEEVKEIYGKHPEYSHYFNHSEENMIKYKENLQKQLGPRYNSTIEKVLDKLKNFEEFKNSDMDTVFYSKNLAQRNMWEVLQKWKNNDISPMDFKYKDNYTGKEKEGKVYFSNFHDLPILPLSKTRNITTGEFEDSGYYNEDFDKIKSNKEYSELWEIYRKMSQYIDSRYNFDHRGRIAFPKIEAEYAERLNENWSRLKQGKGAWKTFKNIIKDSLHEYKGFFYEKGADKDYEGKVNANYIDRSAIEISDRTKVYQLKGYNYEDAKQKATGEILSKYSTDLDRNFKALLLEAALHDARLTVAPTAKAILNRYKDIKTKNGKERENGIKRFEYYIEKVILNHSFKERDTDSIAGKNLSEDSLLSKIFSYLQKAPYIKNLLSKQSLRFLTEGEKELIAHFEDLKGKPFSLDNFRLKDGKFILQVITDKNESGVPQETIYNANGEIVSREVFQQKYQEYIDYKIKNTGLDLSVAGISDGILKSVILKALALSPVGGIFNRVEGMHTNMIMDLTGEYWTVGNMDVAKEMMAFANTMKMSDKFVTGKNKERKETLEVFEKLLAKLDVLQNKKDELQKNSGEVKNIASIIYAWAVDNPEFKNQGEVILSVLMDEIIKDNDGNEHYLLDKKTKQFTPFYIKDGVLLIKDEFKNSFSLNSDQMSRLVNKLETTVSHSQGNYNTYDIMLMKKSWWGRGVMLFKTWLPEHFIRRFGVTSADGEFNINLSTGKRTRNGRFVAGYQASKISFLTYLAATLGISYAGLGLVGIGFFGLIGGYVYTKFLRKMSSSSGIVRDSNIILEMTQFMGSTLLESLNYPSRIMSSIPGMSKLRVDTQGKFNVYKNSNMSEQDIQSLRAMSRELAIMLVGLSVKLTLGALYKGLFGDDEDDDRATARYNFLQNQLSRGINSLNIWFNPEELITDNQKIGLLSYLGNLSRLIHSIVIEHDPKTIKKSFYEALPIPNMISRLSQGDLPWESPMNFDDKKSTGYLPTPMNWVSKAIENFTISDEDSAKKEYKQFMKDLRNDLSEQYKDEADGDEERLKSIVNAVINQTVGKKEKGESYIEALTRIQADQETSDDEIENIILPPKKTESIPTEEETSKED